MGAVKAFIAGAGKLAVALLIVAATLLLGVWGYSTWQTRAQQLREAPLALKKQWETQQLLSSIPVDVATAWRGGRLLYLVSVSDYSDEKYNLLPNAAITLEFFDSDGFKLWEKLIAWSEMTRLTGKDGTDIEGFSWTGDEYASADNYERAGRLAIV